MGRVPGVRGRRMRSAAVIAVVALCLFGMASPASAATGGRYKIVTKQVIQTTVATRLASASVPSASCVLADAVVANSSAQLETGLAQCNGVSLDGTCSSGHTYVETKTNATGYVCHPHGTYSSSSYYEIGADNVGVVNPNGSTGTRMVGRIAGVDYEGIDTYLSGAGGAYVRTWGEWTKVGTDTCSGWAGLAYFSSWKYKDNTNGTIASHTLGTDTSVATSCWAVSAISSGAYHVSH